MHHCSPCLQPSSPAHRRRTPVSLVCAEKMGLSSLTKIDKFEKVAQVYYAVALLAATDWWVGDNFADQSAKKNAVVLNCAQIMGILCSIITAFSYLIRSEVTTKRILVKADYVTAAGWGACTALTVSKQALYIDDKFMINVGIQASITAMYVYQSGLFPMLYQRAMKLVASKSPAKPPPRAKSPARSKSPAKSPARSGKKK